MDARHLAGGRDKSIPSIPPGPWTSQQRASNFDAVPFNGDLKATTNLEALREQRLSQSEIVSIFSDPLVSDLRGEHSQGVLKPQPASSPHSQFRIDKLRAVMRLGVVSDLSFRAATVSHGTLWGF